MDGLCGASSSEVGTARALGCRTGAQIQALLRASGSIEASSVSLNDARVRQKGGCLMQVSRSISIAHTLGLPHRWQRAQRSRPSSELGQSDVLGEVLVGGGDAPQMPRLQMRQQQQSRAATLERIGSARSWVTLALPSQAALLLILSSWTCPILT